jgi:hypothetical protein
VKPLLAVAFLAAALGACASHQPPSPPASGGKSAASSRTVTVRCDIPCGDPARLVAAADSAAALVDRTTRSHVGSIGTIYIHDLAGYIAADKRITGGRRRQSLGFADSRLNEAHIALEPAMPLDLLQRNGAPPHLVRSVAHEATHLAVFKTGAARMPFWMTEGFAEFVAARVGRALGVIPDAANDPWTGRQVLTMRDVAHAMTPQAFDTLWSREPKTLSTLAYANATMLYEWLAADQGALLASLWDSALKLRLLRVSDGITPMMYRARISFAGYRAFLDRQPVTWSEVGRHIAFGRDTIQQPGAGDATVWHWPHEPSVYRLTAGADMLQGLAMGIVLSAPPMEYYIAVVGGVHLTIMRLNTSEGPLMRGIGFSSQALPSAGGRVTFVVDVDSGHVRARINGLPLAVDDPRFGSGTRWGLRTGSRGLVRWTGIRVESLPKR